MRFSVNIRQILLLLVSLLSLRPVSCFANPVAPLLSISVKHTRYGVIMNVVRCAALLAAVSSCATASGGTYYVDPVQGSDADGGKSPVTAWKTLAKINNTSFRPGDKILFKSGGVWTGQLNPKGSGAEGAPIVIDKYGKGRKPLLNGDGLVRDVVYFYNQEYWEIRNLEITNYREGDDPSDPANLKRGIYVVAENVGALRHITLSGLEIHHVNGIYGTHTNDNLGKNNGGVYFEVIGREVPSWFDGILIEDCYVHDVERTGIATESAWRRRPKADPGDWVPGRNLVIRNTVVERCGHNGIIPRCIDGVLIEYCTFINNGLNGNGNAIFAWSCDNVTYQFCEAYGTAFQYGDHDAAGLDGGGLNRNVTIQYNYSHDNGLGGIVCGLMAHCFNINTIIRYNILQNNERQQFRFSGNVQDAKVYNNVIYMGKDLKEIAIIYHKEISQSPNNISYSNNIFYNLSRNSYYNLGESTNIEFSHNLFFGRHPSSEPEDAAKLTADPRFVDPGKGGIGFETLNGYKLRQDSPAIDSGKRLKPLAPADFWGNPIPAAAPVDRGANEYRSKETESKKR